MITFTDRTAADDATFEAERARWEAAPAAPESWERPCSHRATINGRCWDCDTPIYNGYDKPRSLRRGDRTEGR